MNAQRLRYFAAVARLCNFGKASHELNISQPALSRQIQILESELGTTLFTRTNKLVALTETGRLLLQRSAALLDDLDQLKRDIGQLEKRTNSHLTIGAIQSVVSTWLAATLARSRHRFPETTIDLRELTSHKIVDRVRRGYLDIGIVGIVPTGDSIAIASKIREDYFALLSGNHRLAELPSICLRDLAGEVLVQFRQGYVIRDAIDARLAAANVQLEVRTEVDSISAIRTFVAAASHIAILPEFTAKSCQQIEGVTAVRIDDLGLSRDIYVIHNGIKKLSPLSKFVIAELDTNNYKM